MKYVTSLKNHNFAFCIKIPNFMNEEYQFSFSRISRIKCMREDRLAGGERKR